MLVVAALVTACGGGGNDKLVDSYGNTVNTSTNSGSGFALGDSGVDGVASYNGYSILNAPVIITDATGKTSASNVRTGSDGYYRVKVNGFKPPLVIHVDDAAHGAVLYSFSTKALKTNGFITVNTTTITDKIASDLAISAGGTGASDLTPQMVSRALPSDIARFTNALNNTSNPNNFADLVSLADISNYDPIGVPFVTNYTGYDNLLYNLVWSQSGNATFLTRATTPWPPAAVTPVSVPSTIVALAGGWTLNSDSNSITSDIPTLFSKSIGAEGVPQSAASLSDYYWLYNFFFINTTLVTPASIGTLNFSSISTLGSDVTVVYYWKAQGASSYTTRYARYHFTFMSNCGSCGQSSTVVIGVSGYTDTNASYQGGTPFSYTLTYTRSS